MYSRVSENILTKPKQLDIDQSGFVRSVKLRKQITQLVGEQGETFQYSNQLYQIYISLVLDFSLDQLNHQTNEQINRAKLE